MRTHHAGALFTRICCIVLLVVVLFPALTYAEEPSAWDAFNKPGAVKDAKSDAATQPASDGVVASQATSGWVLVLQVLFSLGLIVLLIYLLLRFLANRQLGLNESGPFRIVSSMPLGNGKTLQLVMIGDSLYLLGVGENVQLLRHIPAGEEMDLLLAESQIKSTARNLPGWLSLLKGRKAEESFSITGQSKNGSESFADMLEQQWEEVQKDEREHTDVWDDERGRGDLR